MSKHKVIVRYSEVEQMLRDDLGDPTATITDLTETIEYLYGTGMASVVAVTLGTGR